MGLDILYSNVISLTQSFNLWLILAIFLITLIEEFGISVPYLLESMWLFIGYGVSTNVLAPGAIVLFCLIGLIGREIGASMLYRAADMVVRRS
jgi:hypothetical protein